MKNSCPGLMAEDPDNTKRKKERKRRKKQGNEGRQEAKSRGGLLSESIRAAMEGLRESACKAQQI